MTAWCVLFPFIYDRNLPWYSYRIQNLKGKDIDLCKTFASMEVLMLVKSIDRKSQTLDRKPINEKLDHWIANALKVKGYFKHWIVNLVF